jgi:hypothetical protein
VAYLETYQGAAIKISRPSFGRRPNVHQKIFDDFFTDYFLPLFTASNLFLYIFDIRSSRGPSHRTMTPKCATGHAKRGGGGRTTGPPSNVLPVVQLPPTTEKIFSSERGGGAVVGTPPPKHATGNVTHGAVTLRSRDNHIDCSVCHWVQ